MSSAPSLTINDHVISITGDLIKSGIRKLRQQEKQLDSGQQYELHLDEQAVIDSAGLAYIANIITLHSQTGGKIIIKNIPSKMQQLITLADLDFIFDKAS